MAEPLAEPLEVAEGIMRSARNGSFQGAESKHRVSDEQWPWKLEGEGEAGGEMQKQLEYIVVIQLFFAIAIDFKNAIFDRCRERTHIEGKTRDL